MESVFLKILNMSLSASIVIATVLLVRLLLRKAPKKWSYLLWSVVGFRLCCPVSIGSAFSIFRIGAIQPAVTQTGGQANGIEYIPREIGLMTQPGISIGTSQISEAVSSSLPVPEPAAGADPLQIWIAIGEVLWCAGMAVLLVYSAVSYLKTRRALTGSILLRENIYETDAVRSPFILGLFRPKIFLPVGLEGDTLRYVLAHERYHIRRRDYLVKFFAFLLLIVHWFDPLVWLAFYLMCRDMEMSCDEKVLEGEQGIEKAYSMALLGFATNRRFPAPSPLAFGEAGVKSRIKNVLHWKRPRTWVTLAAAAVCVVSVAACGTNPAAKDGTSGGVMQNTYSGTLVDFSEEDDMTRMRVRIEAELDDGFPRAPLDWAIELAEEEAMFYERVGGEADIGEYHVTDAKLTGLSALNAGYTEENYTVRIYRMEWRILVDHPENVVLAGGMSMEEGWITEQGSTGDRYIILAVSDDGTGMGCWERISGMNADRIMFDYSTPEMLERYGDPYTAVCAETFRKWLAARDKSNEYFADKSDPTKSWQDVYRTFFDDELLPRAETGESIYGVALMDFNFDGVPELVVWDQAASGAASGVMYFTDGAKVYHNLGSTFSTYILTGRPSEQPWPMSQIWAFWLVRSVDTGEHFWCVHSGNGQDGHVWGAYTLLFSAPGGEVVTYDSAGTEGMAEAWEVFSEKYEIVDIDYSVFTLSVYDGDTIDAQSVNALLNSWRPL